MYINICQRYLKKKRYQSVIFLVAPQKKETLTHTETYKHERDINVIIKGKRHIEVLYLKVIAELQVNDVW